MAKRHAPGDIFEVNANDCKYKYFQYIGNDDSQLDADVIAFFDFRNDSSGQREGIDFDHLARARVHAYAHCVIRNGIKLSLWKKIGHAHVYAQPFPFFRVSRDYGDTPLVEISRRWNIWRMNEERQERTELSTAEQGYDLGMVVTHLDVVDMARLGHYEFFHPRY